MAVNEDEPSRAAGWLADGQEVRFFQTEFAVKRSFEGAIAPER
jgi:hypothetical protein